jgi:hypothetical protein
MNVKNQRVWPGRLPWQGNHAADRKLLKKCRAEILRLVAQGNREAAKQVLTDMGVYGMGFPKNKPATYKELEGFLASEVKPFARNPVQATRNAIDRINDRSLRSLGIKEGKPAAPYSEVALFVCTKCGSTDAYNENAVHRGLSRGAAKCPAVFPVGIGGAGATRRRCGSRRIRRDIIVYADRNQVIVE